jgi:aerobic carbon-monoxide dehydrogenase medium subunit
VKPPPFDYVATSSLEEAVATLQEHGDEAKLLAGGQSLVPLLAFRLARPSVLVDLNGVAGLDRLELVDGELVVGAMARQRDVERLPKLRERCALIPEAVELIGHVAIRNRGTVGGSLAHADPAAEWPAIAVILDAELELTGPNGTRTVAARDFFVSYFTTVLEPDEVLTRIRVPLPAGRTGSCFLELSRRHGDFALAGVGALVTLADDGTASDVRLGLIGVGARPVRPATAESALRGRVPDGAAIAEAAAAVADEVEPNGDIHASEEYRRHLATVLTRRALSTAVARAGGGEHAGAA